MKKKDLKSGMIVETRDGDRYLLLSGKMFYFDGYMRLADYTDDLKYENCKGFDIVKVFKDSMVYSLRSMFEDGYVSLLWERKENQLTDREVEILKALKALDYGWLVRDKNGVIYACLTKPEKSSYDYWQGGGAYWYFKRFENLFNFITWEDDEPTSIDDLLKGV